MPLKQEITEEAKNRIIRVSERLFSEKGFDATRVDEIAEGAGVNKALIYYYFKSKEDILDYLVKSFFDDIAALSMDFVHHHVMQMIGCGDLDIQSDRWRFASDEAISSFLQNVHEYYKIFLDFALAHKRTLRIIVLESLKNNKHHNDLFGLLDLLHKGDDNPVFKTIREADPDYTYRDDTVMFKFFFGFIPLISFAAYFDDYKMTSALSERELCDAFLSFYRRILSLQVCGRDLLIWNSDTH